MIPEVPNRFVKVEKLSSTSNDQILIFGFRHFFSLVLLLFGFNGCKECPDLISEKIVIDKNPTTIELNEAIKDMESTLIAKGILTDSLSDSLNEIDKIYLMRRKIKGFMFITDQLNKSKPKSTVVKMDSYYEGCMFFTSYNV